MVQTQNRRSCSVLVPSSQKSTKKRCYTQSRGSLQMARRPPQRGDNAVESAKKQNNCGSSTSAFHSHCAYLSHESKKFPRLDIHDTLGLCHFLYPSLHERRWGKNVLISISSYTKSEMNVKRFKKKKFTITVNLH